MAGVEDFYFCEVLMELKFSRDVEGMGVSDHVYTYDYGVVSGCDSCLYWND